MASTLYMVPPSPPVRSVQITAKALGIHLEEKAVNIFAGENLTADYLKINPQHTVPTLVEHDGFTVWDSHAINAYLVSKYGKDDSLYPKDLKKKAVVDQRLHFDSGVAFPTIATVLRPIIRQQKTNFDDQDKETVNQVYAFLEVFLDGKPWIAGDSKTIADYSLYTSVTSLNVIIPIDDQKYAKLAAWLKKVDALPEAEVGKKGLETFESLVKSKLK